VSLVEVLVAAVLLMVGVGGSLHALAASARLRALADAREALTAEMLDRLAWFEARACAGADTAGVGALPALPAEAPRLRWRVEAVGTVRVLTLDARRGAGAPRVHVVTSRPCE
jgi:hypothetical protein